MITVTRVERALITGTLVLIDKNIFPGKEAVSRFFAGQVPSITPEIVDEIMAYPVSSFETEGMILRGNVAYSGTILYEIVVS